MAGRQPAPKRADVVGDGRLAVRAQPSAARRPTASHPVRDQLLAGARGAQDAFTVGLGDRAYAGTRALMDAAHGADLGNAWRQRWAAERARDESDARRYRTARTVGQIAGTAAGLAVLGPFDAALAGGSRMALAAPITLREAAALGGVGGAGGVGVQAITDLQRGRLGSAGDYAGSALGGAVTALASMRGGAGRASALGGAATSMAQDLFDGRRPSLENAERAAIAGGAIATPFGLAGRAWSNGLERAEKGKLGEALGELRTLANGEFPGQRQLPVKLRSGRRTIVDHTTSGGMLTEQKFGRSHRMLRPNQMAARAENPGRYRVDHSLPRDVGALLAYPFGLLGYHEVASRP